MSNLEVMNQSKYKENIQKLFIQLEERLIEREQLVRLIVLALFSKNHMFLIGSRGVAKSGAIRLINDVFSDTKQVWQLQGSSSTKKENFFGKEYFNENSQISLNTNGTLLDAHVGIIDEMFKIPGEILNSLLEVLVDRYYTIGDGKIHKTDLISVFAASNEYPVERFMEPYVDRFLFWCEVEKIKSSENREKYYAGHFTKEPIIEKYFKLADLEHINESATRVIFPKELVSLYTLITEQFIESGIKTSDRKYGEIVKVFKVSAYLNARTSINYSDLFLLRYTAWHNDIEQDKVKKHLHDTVFYSKEEIKKMVSDLYNLYEEQKTYEKNSLYDVLRYKREFKGLSASENFEFLRSEAKVLLGNYEYLENKIRDMILIYERNKQILQELKENIFIVGVEYNSFSQETIEDVLKLHKTVKDDVYYLNEWLNKNTSLFDYSGNVHKAKDLQ